MSSYIFSILLVVLVHAATVGSTNAFDFGVRYVANNGYETGHKTCTDDEHLLVQVAIDNAMMSQLRRDLRGNKRRKLTGCPSLCAGMSYGGCWSSVPQCRSWLAARDDDDRRALEEEPSLVILDDEFYKGEDDKTPGTRNLEANTTFGITVEQCNEYEAKLFMTILSALDHVSTECANLILSPGSLQCMVIVPPPPPPLTGSPSTVPSGSPTSRPTGSPVR